MTPFERPVVPEVNMMRASSVQERSTPAGSPSGESISAARGSQGRDGSGPAPSAPVSSTTTRSSRGSSPATSASRSR